MPKVSSIFYDCLACTRCLLQTELTAAYMNMLGRYGLAFLVAITCGQIILLSVVVNAQSTVDDSASSCESFALHKAVNVIREEIKDVKLLRGDFSEVKSACASNPQQSTAVSYTHLTLPTNREV